MKKILKRIGWETGFIMILGISAINILKDQYRMNMFVSWVAGFLVGLSLATIAIKDRKKVMDKL